MNENPMQSRNRNSQENKGSLKFDLELEDTNSLDEKVISGFYNFVIIFLLLITPITYVITMVIVLSIIGINATRDKINIEILFISACCTFPLALTRALTTSRVNVGKDDGEPFFPKSQKWFQNTLGIENFGVRPFQGNDKSIMLTGFMSITISIIIMFPWIIIFPSNSSLLIKIPPQVTIASSIIGTFYSTSLILLDLNTMLLIFWRLVSSYPFIM